MDSTPPSFIRTQVRRRYRIGVDKTSPDVVGDLRYAL